VALLKKAYEKIADDVPYLFLFSDRYQFYATTARIQKPADTFTFDIGVDTWWLKP
jgi:peptide/nickel transport system substrate-binding protein/microcin C transport system substrate-binding protein